MFLSRILPGFSRQLSSLNIPARFTNQHAPLPFLSQFYKYTTAAQATEGITDGHVSESLLKVQKDARKDLKELKVFAVVHIAGSQFKVTHNDVIMINKKIEAECGETIKLEKVLAIGGKNFTCLGQPLLKRDMVNVEAMVMEKTRGEKKIAFKMKKRKGYKRWKGHRQDLSVLKIKKINFDATLL